MYGVPCANSRDISTRKTYCIENIAEREAKLAFTQARELAPTEEEIEHQLTTDVPTNG